MRGRHGVAAARFPHPCAHHAKYRCQTLRYTLTPTLFFSGRREGYAAARDLACKGERGKYVYVDV